MDEWLPLFHLMDPVQGQKSSSMSRQGKRINRHRRVWTLMVDVYGSEGVLHELNLDHCEDNERDNVVTDEMKLTGACIMTRPQKQQKTMTSWCQQVSQDTHTHTKDKCGNPNCERDQKYVRESGRLWRRTDVGSG